MITLSSRYAYVLAVVIFIIAIPIWYHAIAEPKVLACEAGAEKHLTLPTKYTG